MGAFPFAVDRVTLMMVKSWGHLLHGLFSKFNGGPFLVSSYGVERLSHQGQQKW